MILSEKIKKVKKGGTYKGEHPFGSPDAPSFTGNKCPPQPYLNGIRPSTPLAGQTQPASGQTEKRFPPLKTYGFRSGCASPEAQAHSPGVNPGSFRCATAASCGGDTLSGGGWGEPERGRRGNHFPAFHFSPISSKLQAQ